MNYFTTASQGFWFEFSEHLFFRAPLTDCFQSLKYFIFYWLFIALLKQLSHWKLQSTTRAKFCNVSNDLQLTFFICSTFTILASLVIHQTPLCRRTLTKTQVWYLNSRLFISFAYWIFLVLLFCGISLT